MAKHNRTAGITDVGSPRLLRCQGCFLPRWSSQWLIGELSLSTDGFAFTQAGKRRFELPLTRITGLAVKRRKFILMRKDVVQLTYALPDKVREKQVWFIAPNLSRWIEQLETLTGAATESCASPDRPAPDSSPHALRWMSKRDREAEPVHVREDQVRDLAATVGAPGARVLWHLWQERHADIEELAALVDARTHTDVLALLREGINAQAQRLLGGPVLAFRERALDPQTGRTVCFQWWLERTEAAVDPDPAEPPVEIHDEGDALLVVAVMPRASEKRPSAVVHGKRLVLAAEAADVPWEMSVPLPCRVLANPAGVTFRNGVLSLRLAKRAKE
jgi:HSP20 family molecular chaperone IbpA